MGLDTAVWRARGFHTDQWIGWVLPLAAQWWPTREALVTARERVTFAELDGRARAVAAQLTALGVGVGDTVTWTLGNSADAVAVASAIWRVGAISNPVVPIYRSHELTAVVSQVRPAVVVAPSDYRGRDYTAEFDDVLGMVDLELKGRVVVGEQRRGWHPLATDPDDDGAGLSVTSCPGDAPCLVLFTSGTTSKPKGAVHSSATLLHECRAMATDWALTWRDAMFMASPLTHITGLLQGFLVPAMTGAKAVLQDRWETEAAIELIEAEGVTYAAGATPFLQGIVDAYSRRQTRPTTLRQFTSGGASVPPQLIVAADGLGIAAHRLWGMTELPTATRANDTVDLWHRAHTDGHVAIGVEVQAVDLEHRTPLPPGSEGELRVRGPERMLGYLDPAMDTEAIDSDGWFYTGDVGVVDADGFVSITGRIKEIINRGGEKFSVRDIEESILRHPQITDVAVVGVPDQRLGEAVAAVVVADVDEADELDPPLLPFLDDLGLAKQKLPTTVVLASELPRTASGKVRRNQIIDELTEGGRR